MSNAEIKIKGDVEGKMEKIKKEIVKEQSLFKDEVGQRYEKMLIAEKKKWEDAAARERREG